MGSQPSCCDFCKLHNPCTSSVQPGLVTAGSTGKGWDPRRPQGRQGAAVLSGHSIAPGWLLAHAKASARCFGEYFSMLSCRACLRVWSPCRPASLLLEVVPNLENKYPECLTSLVEVLQSSPFPTAPHIFAIYCLHSVCSFKQHTCSSQPQLASTALSPTDDLGCTI